MRWKGAQAHNLPGCRPGKAIREYTLRLKNDAVVETDEATAWDGIPRPKSAGSIRGFGAGAR